MRKLSFRHVEDEAGFTVVEMLVALVVIGIVASAFLGLLVSTLGASRVSETRTTANQLAQDYLEQAVEAPWSSIGLYAGDTGYQATGQLTTNTGESTVTLTTSPRPANVPSPSVPKTINGINYTITTAITWQDDASDGTGASDSNGSTQDIKHVVVTVSWTQNSQPHSVTLDDLRSPTATEVPPVSASTALSVAVNAPSSQTLTSTGMLSTTAPVMSISAVPTKTVTAATLTYNTRNGVQTVALTGSGTSWSASLGGAGPFDTGPTTFSVSVTGASGTATGKATVNLLGPGTSTPTITVSAAPSQSLSATNTLSQAIALATTTSSSASSVSVSYPTHSSTVTQSLTGSGTSWSFSVPKDTTVYDVGNETFTFTVTFPGGTTRQGFATVPLLNGALPPDVTAMVVNTTYKNGGTTAGFCTNSRNQLYGATTIDTTVSNVAMTDGVYITAPDIMTTSGQMSYLKTNADGSMVFEITVPDGWQFPATSTLTLKTYAIKTISGTDYRDDYITTVPLQSRKFQSSCV